MRAVTSSQLHEACVPNLESICEKHAALVGAVRGCWIARIKNSTILTYTWGPNALCQVLYIKHFFSEGLCGQRAYSLEEPLVGSSFLHPYWQDGTVLEVAAREEWIKNIGQRLVSSWSYQWLKGRQECSDNVESTMEPSDVYCVVGNISYMHAVLVCRHRGERWVRWTCHTCHCQPRLFCS